MAEYDQGTLIYPQRERPLAWFVREDSADDILRGYPEELRYIGSAGIGPRRPGVYQIRCTLTGKVYVGSSVDIHARWEQHHRLLCRGEHHSNRLQKAWDTYTEAAFEFSVLQFVPREQLLDVEQEWIDRTRSADPEFGFNISEIAGSPGDMYAQLWEGFVDPDGNEVTIFNLHDFCREHNLDFPSMHRLAQGKSKLKSYKGWTHKHSVRVRPFIKTHEGYIDPDGNPVPPITNLAAFCKEHGLDATHMVAVAKGRICSHRGWTHVSGRQAQENPLAAPKTYTGYINPQGERVTITNLQEFCRQNGLHPVKMHEIKNGKRRIYRGWTWRGEDDG